MSIAEASRPDPLAKARLVKAEKAAARKRAENEVQSAEPSPWDIIAELKRELAELKSAPASVAVVPAEHRPPVVNMERATVPGQKLSPASRAKLEEIAEQVATNPDEWRKQQNALTRLKQANPGVWVEVVATRRGVYLRSRQIAPAKYEEYADFTQPETLAISGDDLAKVAPGGIGKKFKIGEKALVTPDAAERLIAQGFVELA
jgi:hypothetical protein